MTRARLLVSITTHQHPDGTVVASAVLSDGRVLRVAGDRRDPSDLIPHAELCKAVSFLEEQRLRA